MLMEDERLSLQADRSHLLPITRHHPLANLQAQHLLKFLCLPHAVKWQQSAAIVYTALQVTILMADERSSVHRFSGFWGHIAGCRSSAARGHHKAATFVIALLNDESAVS